MSEVVLRIDGMSCGHCVGRVKDALAETPGVVVKRVDVGTAAIEYDGRPASMDAIVAAIDRAGYSVRAEEAEAHERR